MHSNFEGSTDSPLEKSFLSKMASKSSVIQHWEIFSCSSINHSFPFKIRSWFLGGILVVWEILRFNPSDVVSGDTEIDISAGSSPVYEQLHPFLHQFPNVVQLGFGSFISRFFLWWVDLLFLWSLLLSRIFPWWLLTFWVLAGKTIGLWLLAFWEHLFGPLLHNCFPFCFRIKRFRVLNAFVSTSVEWGFRCCFLCLLGRWFSRGWALGETFKLIIVEFCWFPVDPYSPFVANFCLLSVFL